LLITAHKAYAQESGSVVIEPDQVQIGLFYGGQEISVRADTPAGYDVVIKLSGMDQDLDLKKKGKRGGVLWMNVGEVEYHQVPALFIINSTRALKDLASEAVLQRLGLDYDALEDQVTSPEEEDARSLYGELIKLKEKEGLFSVQESGIDISPAGSGSQQAAASFFLPPKAPRGEYRVEVFGFKDGNGSLLESGTIKLDFAPSTAFIFNMAKKHGLAYGCLASAIAIIAGLMTGYIFGGKSESH
jgi:uncharacterized protein (TIGR02186 family)